MKKKSYLHLFIVVGFIVTILRCSPYILAYLMYGLPSATPVEVNFTDKELDNTCGILHKERGIGLTNKEEVMYLTSKKKAAQYKQKNYLILRCVTLKKIPNWLGLESMKFSINIVTTTILHQQNI